MELLPKELQNKIPKLYETERIPTSDKIIYARYYAKNTNWVWYAVEYSKDDDKIFFGYVQGFTNEWGYFGLKEFEDINKKEQLIIRDEKFTPTKFKDLEL